MAQSAPSFDAAQLMLQNSTLLVPCDTLFPELSVSRDWQIKAARLGAGWDEFEQFLSHEDAPPSRPIVAKRRREMIAARILARLLMVDLGLPPLPLPRGKDRAPIWPAGCTGSITHTDDLCVVVMGKTSQSIGIDVEPQRAIDPKLLPSIARPSEIARSPNPHEDVLRLFVAKEAFYKAQFTTTKRMLGHQDVDITFLPDDRFSVRVARKASDDLMPAPGHGRLSGNATYLTAHWIMP